MAAFAPRDVVSVLPDRLALSVAKLKDLDTVPRVHGPLPLKEALEKEWETDAHLQCYLVEPFDPADACFRLKKPILPEIYAHGGWVTTYIFCVDLDTADHKAWDPDTWGDFWALIESFKGTRVGERLDCACIAYATRKGFRWIFRLTRGLFEKDAEKTLRGFLAELRAAGLPVDSAPTLATWNCTFRLPRVVRDGIKTSADPFFYASDVDLTKSLDPSTIVPLDAPEHERGSDEEGPVPHDTESEELLVRRNDRGTASATEFAKEAKKVLEGQVYFSYLFEGKKLDVAEGSRHNTIRAWTLNAAGHLVRRMPEATPAHLYALFHVVAGQVEGRDGRRDVRRLCAGAWTINTAELQEEQSKQIQQKQVVVEQKLDGAERIIQGVRAWHPGLPQDPIAAWAWIQRRMILKEKKRGVYFILSPEGTYPSETVEESSIIAQVKQSGMDKHIPTTIDGKSGPRPIRVSDLSVNGYVTNISRVEYRPEIGGGFIVNPTEDQKPALAVRSFRRNPALVPTFHEGVDRWLRALGDLEYDILCRHIGCFLAWERGPVAAISFILLAGAGKGMFIQGLLECLEDYKQHVPATADDLVQKFNSKLAVTPFILLNEGMTEGEEHHHAADSFRRVVTGDYFQTEGKGKDSVSFKFPFRVVLTANHWRLIDALGEGRDLAPDEREALGLRLHHYVPRDKGAATKLLASMGGREWTRGWVEDEDGHSDFIVAKHFLWLHQKYGKDAKVQGKGRLLVEGDPNQPAIQRLRTKGGSTPTIIEALVNKIFNNPMLQMDGSQGIFVRDGHLYVTVGAILDSWRNNLTRGATEKITANKVRMGLKGLLAPGAVEGADDACWNEIDVALLITVAQTYGWYSTKLNAIAVSQQVGHNGTNGTNGTNGIGHEQKHEPRILMLPGGA